MANPTNADRRAAAEIGDGLSPSTLRGRNDAGYGPAEPLARGEYITHHRVLHSLMSSGKDGDVVTLKMADTGYPCRRLRDVLASYRELLPGEEDSEDADDLIEYMKDADHLGPIRGAFESAIDATVPLGTAFPDETKRMMLGSALLSPAQAVVGEPFETKDLIDYSSVEDGLYRKMGLPVDWSSDDPEMLNISLAGLQKSIALVRQAATWLTEATAADLVRGVKAAKVLMDGTESLGILSFGGEEERWHWIGRTAPTAESVLSFVAHLTDLVVTGLGSALDELPPHVRTHLMAYAARNEELLSSEIPSPRTPPKTAT